jgi:hypothetical protein
LFFGVTAKGAHGLGAIIRAPFIHPTAASTLELEPKEVVTIKTTISILGFFLGHVRGVGLRVSEKDPQPWPFPRSGLAFGFWGRLRLMVWFDQPLGGDLTCQ